MRVICNRDITAAGWFSCNPSPANAAIQDQTYAALDPYLDRQTNKLGFKSGSKPAGATAAVQLQQHKKQTAVLLPLTAFCSLGKP
jgi:hypothetical protein